MISANTVRKIDSAYEIQRFFSFYSKRQGYSSKQVDEAYRFLRKIDINSISCLQTVAEYLSVHNRLFENNLSYTLSLSTLYMEIACIVNLKEYHVCDVLNPKSRANVVRKILLEYDMHNDKKYREFLINNFRQLMIPVDYFNMNIIDYSELFRNDIIFETFIKLVYKAFDEEDAFDILYCVYREYVSNHDNKNYAKINAMFMRNITRKTKIKLILNYYPISVNIKHWFGYQKRRQ